MAFLPSLEGLQNQVDPLQTVTQLLELWDIITRLYDKFRYRGPYEILDYDSTLDIRDPQGAKAILTRREEIRFLQDNIVAIHDHAWGVKYPIFQEHIL